MNFNYIGLFWVILLISYNNVRLYNRACSNLNDQPIMHSHAGSFGFFFSDQHACECTPVLHENNQPMVAVNAIKITKDSNQPKGHIQLFAYCTYSNLSIGPTEQNDPFCAIQAASGTLTLPSMLQKNCTSISNTAFLPALWASIFKLPPKPINAQQSLRAWHPWWRHRLAPMLLSNGVDLAIPNHRH